MHVLIQSLMLFFKSLMMTLWGRLTPASLFPHFTAFTAGNALKVLSEFLSSLRNKSRTWWRMSEYPTSEPVHSGYLQMTGSIFKHMLIKSEYSWKTHTQWKTCQLSLPAKKKKKRKKEQKPLPLPCNHIKACWKKPGPAAHLFRGAGGPSDRRRSFSLDTFIHYSAH